MFVSFYERIDMLAVKYQHTEYQTDPEESLVEALIREEKNVRLEVVNDPLCFIGTHIDAPPFLAKIFENFVHLRQDPINFGNWVYGLINSEIGKVAKHYETNRERFV